MIDSGFSLAPCVSIHAAQAGCDKTRPRAQDTAICFNSRSPSGLRQSERDSPLHILSFNSRSPSGLRQVSQFWQVIHLSFNSRSPSGLRPYASAAAVPIVGFNSRSPSGLRPTSVSKSKTKRPVSIHAAQAGCDKQFLVQDSVGAVSIHAAQAGCDIDNNEITRYCFAFQFTQPKRAATTCSSNS